MKVLISSSNHYIESLYFYCDIETVVINQTLDCHCSVARGRRSLLAFYLNVTLQACQKSGHSRDIQKNLKTCERNLSRFTISTNSRINVLKNRIKQRRDEKGENDLRLKGVCFGLVLLPRRKGSLAFTHSCKVTIYNRPPFLLLAILRLEKMKKATTP